MKKLLLIVVMTTLWLNYALAASFSVRAPRQVSAGEKFTVTYSLEGANGENLQAPRIEGCKYIYGPAVAHSESYQIVKGRQSSSVTTDYSFTYRAESAGTFTIPPASIRANGKTLTTHATKFQVVSAGSAVNSTTQTSRGSVDVNDPDTQTIDRNVNSNDLFVRIILNKSTAYEQEAIECTIKLYTKYSISSFLPTKQPAFDGFLVEEVDMSNTIGQMESYNGQNYMTAVLKKCILFPQKSGKLTISSGEYDLNVVQYDHVNMGFFQVRDPHERQLKVSSNSASIDIKPLPEPRPEGFCGAVGSFKVDTRLIGNSFKTNDPATLIYTITGTGNVKYIHEPVVNFPAEFEQYTPKSDSEVKVSGNNVTGKMTVDYTFVPQSVGTFTIPASKFVYFDPERKEYVQLPVPAHTITVSKGSEAKAASGAVKPRIKDILPIHTLAKGQPNHTPVIYSALYWIIYPIIFAIVLVIIYMYRRHIRQMADVAGHRLARAGKVARRRLKAAKGFMDRGKSDQFYEEMLRAMWGYLSDKLTIPVSKLSRDNISAELSNYGADPDVIESIITILDDCEIARYTPDSSSRMTEVYGRAADAISQLETKKQNRQKS